MSRNPEYTPSQGKEYSVLNRAKHGCLVLGLLGSLTLGSSVAQAVTMDRSLSLYNIHTKENLNITYKREGRYDPKALDKINWFMRDWRTNQTTRMDPKLLDLMWEVHQDLGSKKPVHVISSYRSPKTNQMLRRKGRKVARNSQHTKGRAVDVYFPDISTKKIRENALIREIGGVGYYPRSLARGFVHIDTGSVRHWPRMSANTYAKLFPNGKSKHRPRRYPSKALYAKYRAKTPERHIQMALASKSGNTFDVREGASIQLAAAKKPGPQPVAPVAPVTLTQQQSKPAEPAPIILTSAKILKEQAAPARSKPAVENKPRQLAELKPSNPGKDPLNTPLSHGLKPVEVAALETKKPTYGPADSPLAHGLKPVEVASNMDVKIIPASASPKQENPPAKGQPTPQPEAATIDIASAEKQSEGEWVDYVKPEDGVQNFDNDKKLPPVNIAFSQASFVDLSLKEKRPMPRVNRALKGDLLMTTFYKKQAPKPKKTASHSAQMNTAIMVALTLSWDDQTHFNNA